MVAAATRAERASTASPIPKAPATCQLAQRAGALWDQASEQLGSKLLHRTGMLYMGPPGETFLSGHCIERSQQQPTDGDTLTWRSLSSLSRLRDSRKLCGLFDSQAGWIDVDASIQASHAHARSLGVDCFFDRPVLGWDATADEVIVSLQNETVTAAKLVVTAGAWTSSLLRDLALPLSIKRKVLAWFAPQAPELFAADRIPVFTFPENCIYGFPGVPVSA